MKMLHVFIVLFTLIGQYVAIKSFATDQLKIDKEILSQNKSMDVNEISNDSIYECEVTDTTKFYVRIEGKNNNVEINGKKTYTTSDTLETKNKVIVSGDNNSIKITQNQQKSEVIILQKGGNNKISISQHN